LGTNFFGNHLNFALFLILPIYLLFSNPYTLLFIQTLFLGLAAYPLYYIVKKELDGSAAFVFVLLYLIHPGINYTNLNEFHPESFFPLLFFCSFYYLISRRIKYFFIFALLCLMLKENFSLVIAMLGLYGFFVHKEKTGLVLFLLSVVWFYLAFFIIIPPLNKGIIGYFNIYPYFGDKPFEIIKNAVSHPLTVIQVLFTEGKIKYIACLIGPLCFLPLLGFQAFILALPLFLQHLLSSRPMEYDISFYYSSEILPPLFICALYGLKRIYKLCSLRVMTTLLVIIFAIGLFYSLKIGPLTRLFINNRDFNTGYLNSEKSEFMKLVPAKASIAATFEFLPGLSNRKDLYSFHYVYTGFSILSKLKYELPDTVEYVLIDFNDPMTFRVFYSINYYKNLQKFLIGKEWEVKDYVDTLVMLKRGRGAKFDLCQQLYDIPKEMAGKNSPILAGGSVELAGYTLDERVNDGILGMTFYWRSIQETQRDMNIILDILDDKGNLLTRKMRPICYRIFPTNSWHKGEVFKDVLRIKIPGSPRNYKVKISFFDYQSGELLRINGPADDFGRVNILDVK
jgi:uncharacterized membrane protein